MLIIAALVSLALFCLVMKTLFTFWLFRLERKQDDYLDTLDEELKISEGSLEVSQSLFAYPGVICCFCLLICLLFANLFVVCVIGLFVVLAVRRESFLLASQYQIIYQPQPNSRH